MCDKDPETGLYIDDITSGIINPDRLVQIEGRCFDIETLYRYYKDNKFQYPIDPFTKKRLPSDIADLVLSYGEQIQVTFNVIGLDGIQVQHKFPPFTRLGTALAEIMDKTYDDIRNLGFITYVEPNNQTDMFLEDLDDEVSLFDQILLEEQIVYTSGVKNYILDKIVDFTKDKMTVGVYNFYYRMYERANANYGEPINYYRIFRLYDNNVEDIILKGLNSDYRYDFILNLFIPDKPSDFLIKDTEVKEIWNNLVYDLNIKYDDERFNNNFRDFIYGMTRKLALQEKDIRRKDINPTVLEDVLIAVKHNQKKVTKHKYEFLAESMFNIISGISISEPGVEELETNWYKLLSFISSVVGSNLGFPGKIIIRGSDDKFVLNLDNTTTIFELDESDVNKIILKQYDLGLIETVIEKDAESLILDLEYDQMLRIVVGNIEKVKEKIEEKLSDSGFNVTSNEFIITKGKDYEFKNEEEIIYTSFKSIVELVDILLPEMVEKEVGYNFKTKKEKEIEEELDRRRRSISGSRESLERLRQRGREVREEIMEAGVGSEEEETYPPEPERLEGESDQDYFLRVLPIQTNNVNRALRGEIPYSQLTAHERRIYDLTRLQQEEIRSRTPSPSRRRSRSSSRSPALTSQDRIRAVLAGRMNMNQLTENERQEVERIRRMRERQQAETRSGSRSRSRSPTLQERMLENRRRREERERIVRALSGNVPISELTPYERSELENLRRVRTRPYSSSEEEETSTISPFYSYEGDYDTETEDESEEERDGSRGRGPAPVVTRSRSRSRSGDGH